MHAPKITYIALITLGLTFILLLTLYPSTAMRRALTHDDIVSRKHQEIDFSEPFYQAFGKPEQSGIWFVWGDSGNGKTSFMLQLAKELSTYGKVAYISLEEHRAKTFKDAIILADFNSQQKRNIIFPPDETIEEVDERLSRHKAPRFAIIDSLQYANMNFTEFIAFKNKHANKLIIFMSQVDGKKPLGRTAVRVMFDADLKIWIEGYLAKSKGRYIGPNGGTYVIWKKGAEEIWGGGITKNLNHENN